jgi:DNA-binding response OmpR family regulator/Tfp pilus assembly protein PilZ
VYREHRIVTRCTVEFQRKGKRVEAETEDLSVRGAFVRTESLLAVGAVVTLVVRLPEGPPVEVVSRVAHALEPSVAAILGRRAGMGVEFLEHTSEGREQLSEFLDRIADLGPEAVAMPGQAFAVVADSSAQFRDRIENALAAVGFESLLFRTSGEALKACGEFTPDVVVAAIGMPDFDGVSLLARLKAKPSLCDVPVVLLASSGDDFERLQAYRMGVRDVVTMPFTDEELCIRVRRAAIEARRTPIEPVLRGSLAEISLQTLLSLFEFERKSGTLLVFANDAAARLSIAAGRVIRVEGARSGRDPVAAGGAVARLMRVLDWNRGQFEFSAGEVLAAGDEVGLRTSEIILEHARLRDEIAEPDPGS